MKKQITFLLSAIILSTSLFNTNISYANVIDYQGVKNIKVNEKIVVTKQEEDKVSDFHLTGALTVKENIPYSVIYEYNINDKNASFNSDKFNNLFYDITTKSFKNNQIIYDVNIKTRASLVKYNINEALIKEKQSYPNSVKKFMNPDKEIQSDNPSIKNIAKNIVQSETNPYKKAKLIFDYTYMNMDYVLEKGNNTALDAVNTKEGVCTDYSRLMVALLRAEGIPARTISGYRIPADAKEINLRENQYNHMWVEFYIEEYGWIPADPTISFVGKKFIVDTNFANLSQYYVPIAIDSPMFKKYEYMRVKDSNPNVAIDIYTNGYLFDYVNEVEKEEEKEKEKPPIIQPEKPLEKEKPEVDKYKQAKILKNHILFYKDNPVKDTDKFLKYYFLSKFTPGQFIIDLDSK